MFVNRKKHSNEEKILKSGTMCHCRTEWLDTLFGAWKHEDCTKKNQNILTIIFHELQQLYKCTRTMCVPSTSM